MQNTDASGDVNKKKKKRRKNKKKKKKAEEGPNAEVKASPEEGSLVNGDDSDTKEGESDQDFEEDLKQF